MADNSEVVYEGQIRLAILQGIPKALPCDASRLVLVTSGLAGTADALWLKMEVTTDIVAIDGERDEGMQGTAKVTTSPAPPAAQGIKTVRLIFVVSLTSTAALARAIERTSTTRHIVSILVALFIAFSSG